MNLTNQISVNLVFIKQNTIKAMIVSGCKSTKKNVKKTGFGRDKWGIGL
jgi:hypothetical protein